MCLLARTVCVVCEFDAVRLELCIALNSGLPRRSATDVLLANTPPTVPKSRLGRRTNGEPPPGALVTASLGFQNESRTGCVPRSG